MTARFRSKLFTASMALVFTLPYVAPSTCGLLGRMGAAVEMTQDAGDSALQTPGSAGICCALSECGVPYIAPLANALVDLPVVPVVRAELAAPSPAPPTNVVSPLTPPPQA
ncbi:MAG: hypothetical protein IID05_11130 [Gemmatimonadetes bacterium]|nr:hypothetical protein [Gemmatimonadota bacterium]